MASAEAIPLVAAIIGLGVGAQLLAARFRVPSIIFLLIAGILLGPAGIGRWLPELADFALGPGNVPEWIATMEPFVTEETFGGALPAIVGLSVAVIVFEGAFHLKIQRIRGAPAATLRLVTIGAAIALVGTAVAVKFLLDQPWDVAFTIGALLVATGPTVITPILSVVPVRDRVAAALETEGIVNDVSAAIIAVVVFEVVVIGDTSAGGEFLREFVSRLGIGLIVGMVVAGIVYYLIKYVDLSPANAPQNSRLLVLASALVAFAAADTIASEAGVAAVATAGVLLGNADLPYEEDIAAFKGDVTLVVLSVVFISLAALLQFEDLIALGIPGLVVVALIMLIIRPLLVFVSVYGGRFTLNEKLFISFVGPRGIIPASVATLFAVELSAQGMDEAASALVGTVFLVIFATVAIEGAFARYIAEYLDVIPMRIIIVGAGKAGRALADRLEDRGENVVLVEEDEDIVEQARNEGYTVEWGDGTDTEVLRSAGAENAKVVVAATGDDDANLLVSQLASTKFDPEQVIARANNPDNVDAFEDLGVRTIDSGMATAWAMDNQIERPALAHWMTDVGRDGDVQEVELTGGEFVGKPIREIGPMLPDRCIVALVSRDGQTQVPSADFVVEEGDHLTLLGDADAVSEAMGRCRGA